MNLLEGYTKNTAYAWKAEYADDNVCYVVGKEISVPESQQAVTADNNSQYLPLRVDRYYDGVDLSNKTFKLRFQNAGNVIGNLDAINVQYNDAYILMGFLLNSAATSAKGKLKLQLIASGVNQSNEAYEWRTQINSQIAVMESIGDSGYSMEEALSAVDQITTNKNNITALSTDLTQLSNRVTTLENTGTWSGGGTSSGTSTGGNTTVSTSNNLLNPNKFEVGLLQWGGGLNAASSSARTTEYIPVTAGYTYSIGVITAHTENPNWSTTEFYGYYRCLAFYDEDKAYLDGFSNTAVNGSQNTHTTITAPSGAKYLRVSFAIYRSVYASSNPEMFFIYKGTPSKSDILPYGYTNVLDTGSSSDSSGTGSNQSGTNNAGTDSNPYYGKTLTVFGDSLSDACGGHDWNKTSFNVGGIGWNSDNIYVSWEGYGFLSRICREFGITLDNRAESGSNINQGNNGAYADVCGVNIFDAWLTEIEAGTATKPEVVLFQFGTNTIASQVGNASDTALTTVYGATKHCIEKMREKLPRTRFGFVLPIVANWDGVSTVKDTEAGAAAIKAVCKDMNVPYIDMKTASGITLDMLPDGIHPKSIEANTAYYYALRGFFNAGISNMCEGGATTVVEGGYTKPTTGIPKSDLATDVQTSLVKADSAYQKPAGGIPLSDCAFTIPSGSGGSSGGAWEEITGFTLQNDASLKLVDNIDEYERIVITFNKGYGIATDNTSITFIVGAWADSYRCCVSIVPLTFSMFTEVEKTDSFICLSAQALHNGSVFSQGKEVTVTTGKVCNDPALYMNIPAGTFNTSDIGIGINIFAKRKG